jgi:hypothetical protein
VGKKDGPVVGVAEVGINVGHWLGILDGM